VQKDSYVKIVGVDGSYRYGYIVDVTKEETLLTIDLYEEGESKIAFDSASQVLLGVAPVDYMSLLTDVEKRIVPLIAAGYNTNQIACEMSIAASTVRAHLRTLRIKLHLDDRLQLIAFSQALKTYIEDQQEAEVAI